jgi:hypothetical protein
MFEKNLNESLNKIRIRLVKPKVKFAIQNRNNFNRKTLLATLCLLIIIVLGAVIADFGSNKNVVRADSVVAIGAGIYWDQACTNRTLQFNWGLIGASSSNNLTVYVRNECNSAVSLELITSTWTPSTTSEYISLNWNYTGQILKTDEVIPIELTLKVDPTIVDITNFSFETTITTIEQ